MDFSNQNFGPGEIKILAWRPSTEIAALGDVLDILGSKYKHDQNICGVEKYDIDVTGIEALETVNFKSLIVKKCGLGPKAIIVLTSTLSTLSSLEEIDLRGNKLEGQAVKDMQEQQPIVNTIA